MSTVTAPERAPAHAADAPHLANPDLYPSFTKGVFLGEIREDLVFPFPVLADDERESLRMIIDSFRSWAADNVDSKQLDHDGKFPDAVQLATNTLRPHFLSLHLYELAGEFSTFYAADKVLVDDPAVRARRFLLCHRTLVELESGLHLLGIRTDLERM